MGCLPCLKGSAQRLRILTTSCPCFRGRDELRWWRKTGEEDGGGGLFNRGKKLAFILLPVQESHQVGDRTEQRPPHLSCLIRFQTKTFLTFSFSFPSSESFLLYSQNPQLFLISYAYADMQRDANKSRRRLQSAPVL